MNTLPEEVPSELQGYRRVATEPTNVVDPPADKPARPQLPVQARWIRIAKIIVVYTLLAPLIVTGIVLIFEIGWYLFVPRVENPRGIHFGFGFASGLTFLVALPWMLLTSTVYATIAVVSGWRHLFVSLAIALLPMLFFPWFLSGGIPFGTITLVTVPTIVCWILTRRWHSPNT